MELKDVYTALEKVENGAELITAIKAEINTLNNEAKKHRIAGEQSTTKLKSILDAVGLTDGEDVVEKAKGMKATLDQFAQGGKKPDEVAKQITTLTKQVETVTTQLADMTKQADEQRAKYIASQKMAKAVEALTKGNAAAPKDMAKLLLDNIKVNDDDSLAYTGADGKDVSVEDGVNSWLKDNAWAVKVNNNGGGGAGGGAGGGESTTINIVNAGSADVPLIVELIPTKTMADVTINHTDTGRVMRVADTLLTAPAVLTIDTKAGTVRRDANNAINSFSGQFLTAKPGPNTYEIKGSAGKVVIRWRDRWLA